MRKKSHSSGRVSAADLVWGLAVLLVIWGSFTFRFVRTVGDSMYPHLHDGQLMVVDTRYRAEQLRPDDVVVFETGSGYAVKRILAVAGDHVALADGAVHINFMKVLPYTCDADADQAYDLEEGQYFVIGDNFPASYDSRDYGPIDSDAIVGKVVVRF